jgi:hypothetical protein
MEFNEAESSPLFTNQPKPRDVKYYDPWAAPDPYMGRPRPIEDISQLDFRDAEFRQFARNGIKTHNRKAVVKTLTEKWAANIVFVGSSEDE